MPTARISAGVLAMLWLTGPAAYAQKGKGGPSTHGGGAKATAPTSHGSSHATGGPKTTTTKTHGTPHTMTTTKAHGNPHTAKATTTKTRGNPHTTTATKRSATSTATNASTSTTTLNPIAQKLRGKPLGDRIQQMLPKGMTLDTASAGFKNQGQFIAAVHVSQNLGIPFTQLKAAMLGTSTTTATTTTSTNPMSLGQAIHRLRPTVNAGAEVERAETQAAADARGTSMTSTTATISAAKSKKQKQ